MIWLIYILNFFIWIAIGIIMGAGFESALFGVIYFIVGLILSFIFFKYSDNYAVSILDKFENPPFSVLIKKLAWSNGAAHAVIWILIILVILGAEFFK